MYSEELRNDFCLLLTHQKQGDSEERSAFSESSEHSESWNSSPVLADAEKKMTPCSWLSHDDCLEIQTDFYMDIPGCNIYIYIYNYIHIYIHIYIYIYIVIYSMCISVVV